MSSSNTPIDIFDNNIYTDDEKCAICLSSINDPNNPTYAIIECSHRFHTTCLITWFRHKDSSCPLCRNKLDNNNVSYGNRNTIFSLISRYSRKKDADKFIVKMMKKYKDNQAKAKEINKELRHFKKDNKDVISKFLQLEKKCNSARWKVIHIKNRIINMPIIPLFI